MVAFVGAEAVVPVEGLPFPVWILGDAGEAAFPESHPSVEGQAFWVLGGAVEVEVFGHEEVASDGPRMGFIPSG